MVEKIVFETEVKTGNSATSVKSVKAELRQLKTEMAGLEIGSQQFTNMAQRAGQLEDAIGDANAAVKAFNPEAKFQAFAGVLGGVANGFSVVQGTMALFGSENEEVEKAILKTQAAIAIATGINGLMGMKDAFVILGTVIKTQVVSAFATMRAAIMSTGIIALVAVIGTLIYSWMQEKEANEEATKELERFGEAQRKLLDQEQKIQIARSKGRDKDVLEASAASQANIRAFAKELEDKKITQEEFNKLVKGEQELMRIAVNEIDKKYAEEAAKNKLDADEKEKQRLKVKREEEEKAFTKQMYQEIDAQKMLNQMLDEMDSADWNKALEELENQAEIKASLSEDEANKLLAIRKLTNEEIAKMALMSYSEQVEYLKKIAEEEKKIDKDKAQAKVEALQMTSAALIGYSQVLGQETEAGKALAAAAAAIDTYVAASSVFKNVLDNPYLKALPDGGLTIAIGAAAAAVAGGLARVKAIYAVKVPGGSGGGGGAGTPPSVPQFNPAVAQQVQGGGDVQLGMKPQKVYVVESDIRGTMNKVDVIEANATIG
jgi:hypothetical protein